MLIVVLVFLRLLVLQLCFSLFSLSRVKKIIMSEIKKYLKNVTVNGSIFVECYARARRSRPFNADR